MHQGLPGRPVFYASAESHLAWLKIAHMTGLGRDAVRLVPVDAALRIDLDRLREAYAVDVAGGRIPFMIVGTAGTTGAGVLDPLGPLADHLKYCSVFAGLPCSYRRTKATSRS